MTGSRPLRVLVDVTHPAHVHLFKHTVETLQQEGHRTVVTSRENGITTDLLDAYDIDHRPITGQRSATVGLFPEWVVREYKLARVAVEFQPDVVVSHFTPCPTHAAHLAGAQSLVFNDDEAAVELAGKLTVPFATFVYTPETFSVDIGPKHRRYRGYHELAYLHPSRFEPDPSVLEANGVDPSGQFFVLRFGSREPRRDDAATGFSSDAKRELVGFLEQHGDVYIVGDGGHPDDSNRGQAVPVPPEHIHHLLAYADLYAGDSGTMAVEAGLLGTPSVRSNAGPEAGVRGRFRELESKYSLVLSFDSDDKAVVTAKNLAVDPKANERWVDRRDQLLDDTIDVTEFMVETIRRQGYTRQEPTEHTQQHESTYELA
jgi:predicted glycosyltransferase